MRMIGQRMNVQWNIATDETGDDLFDLLHKERGRCLKDAARRDRTG
jgi:hypothetical protein